MQLRRLIPLPTVSPAIADLHLSLYHVAGNVVPWRLDLVAVVTGIAGLARSLRYVGSWSSRRLVRSLVLSPILFALFHAGVVPYLHGLADSFYLGVSTAWEMDVRNSRWGNNDLIIYGVIEGLVVVFVLATIQMTYPGLPPECQRPDADAANACNRL